MAAKTNRKNYRFSDETLAKITDVQDVLEELTGIRPSETAVIELAVEQLRRLKLGRRHSDRVPIRRRPSR